MFAMVVFCSWSGAGQASGRGQISSHGNSHRRRETDMFSSCPSLRTSVCSRLCRAVCHSVCRCAVVFNQRPLRSRGRPWMDRGGGRLVASPCTLPLLDDSPSRPAVSPATAHCCHGRRDSDFLPPRTPASPENHHDRHLPPGG